MLSNISKNIFQLRQKRGITLSGLSELSGVSKSTLSSLESGYGNPTIETLWAIANALDVPFSSLVYSASHTDPAELEEGGVVVRFIERSDEEPRVEAYILNFAAGARKESAPHPQGVVEKITVLSGRVWAGPVWQPRLVFPGETVAITGDVPHVYASDGGVASALVVIEYPQGTRHYGSLELILDPSRNHDNIEELKSAFKRILLEAGLGVKARRVRLKRPGQDFSEKSIKFPEFVSKSPGTCFKWPVTLVTFDYEEEILFYIFPARATNAFSGANNTATYNGHLNEALRLSSLAETTHKPLSENNMEYLLALVADTSFLLSSLAFEILANRGKIILPGPLGSHGSDVSSSIQRNREERSFSSRIDVKKYNTFELIHPAYARQVVALTQDIFDFRPDFTKPGCECIDVGTGPGTPLFMLKEIMPDLKVEAIEPDDLAFQLLDSNNICKETIEPKKIDFLKYDREEPVPLIISVGASHHFNTAFFFQKSYSLLEDGGLLIIADELLPCFSTPEERHAALIRHHCAYILSSLPPDHDDFIKNAPAQEISFYEAFRDVAPVSVFEVEAGLVSQAVRRCRDLYARLKDTAKDNHFEHPAGAMAQFFWLEWQAMVAGFDYEIECKTYPGRFKELGRMAGFELKRHRRIFATEGSDSDSGGTHVFTFAKPEKKQPG